MRRSPKIRQIGWRRTRAQASVREQGDVCCGDLDHRCGERHARGGADRIRQLPARAVSRGFERELLQRHLPWLVPHHYSPEHDRLITSVHSWLIRTDGTPSCSTAAAATTRSAGLPRFHQRDTPYLARLREAGAAPEDIDIVLCTHLHADHVGWNTMLRDGRWVPTFPNAKYLFSRIENEYGDPRRNPRRMPIRSAAVPIATACCR
jgi:hypothetical protein